MAEATYDLAVIGAGPAGYVAAIRAAQLGLKTAIVEREHLGGICLNWGCIPTKALLRTSELYHQMGRATEFGLACDNLRFDLARVIERSRKVAAKLASGVAYLMKKIVAANDLPDYDMAFTATKDGASAIRFVRRDAEARARIKAELSELAARSERAAREDARALEVDQMLARRRVDPGDR